ncbi:MAG: conjugal transfer protein TrbF [Sphingorhabdus sp.]
MRLFKRSAIRYAVTPEAETPYRRAGQIWDRRIGSARVQAKNWRLMAFGSLALSIATSAALFYQSLQGSIVPWVVSVDKYGEAKARGPATADYKPGDPQIAFHLARFIENVRSIAADPVIVRKNWLSAYDYVTDKGALALNDYAKAHDPFAQIGEHQVAVEISSVIRASQNSFRIAWQERHYENGQLERTERWSAIVTLAIQPPDTADALRKNPLGIFVHALNWSKEL